jgi:hypothetical protein
MSFSHSLHFAKLNTGKRARQERAVKALVGLGYTGEFHLLPLSQASASEVIFPSGLRVLISYETCVAYRLHDGSEVATFRNEYSRTTDRSVSDFLKRSDAARLEVSAFRAALTERLKS